MTSTVGSSTPTGASEVCAADGPGGVWAAAGGSAQRALRASASGTGAKNAGEGDVDMARLENAAPRRRRATVRGVARKGPHDASAPSWRHDFMTRAGESCRREDAVRGQGQH